MTYQEAIDRIHEFCVFGSRLGLERMEKLMSLLGDPQDRVRTIHVAGTNGKGSVCRYIYSVLQEAGYKTGIYTSPFLERFTERIEVGGREISEEELAFYTEKVLRQVDVMIAAGFDSPTEFELITAIGFCYFAEQQADFLILEVGLGGSGDSTNIIKNPAATVVTSISFDHTEQLGSTLAQIAAEKAGIIKTLAPVVSNVSDESARSVIMAAAESHKSPWFDASAIPGVSIKRSIDNYSFDVDILGKTYRNVEISMIGLHQIRNAICALSVLEVLKRKNLISLDDRMVYSGMRKARQTGRLEILRQDPYFIIDGAHNEAGAEALSEVIFEHFKNKRILLIIGMLKDKDSNGILNRLIPAVSAIIAVSPDNPRRLSAEELRELIMAKGRDCLAMDSIEAAVSYAEENRNLFDVILFAGSLYLVGKVRGILSEKI